jgi:hypothetical protein
MHLYLTYARAHWTRPDENPPVGRIFCAQHRAGVARYSLEGLPNKVPALRVPHSPAQRGNARRRAGADPPDPGRTLPLARATQAAPAPRRMSPAGVPALPRDSGVPPMVYVRRSGCHQVRDNRESLARQFAFRAGLRIGVAHQVRGACR